MVLRIESRGVRIERIRRARAIGWLTLAVLFPLTFLTAEHHLCAVPAVGMLFDALILATFYTEPRHGALRRSDTSGVVYVDDQSIVLEQRGERRQLLRGDLLEGWIESVEGAVRVAIRLRGADVLTVEVDGDEHARAVLRAAGLSAEQRVLRMTLTSAASRQAHGEFFRVLGLLGLGPAFPVLAAIALSAASRWRTDLRASISMVWAVPLLALDVLGLWKLAQGFKAPVATIGSDGVAIRSTGRSRFVPFSNVTRAELTETGVRLLLESGGFVVLAVDPIVGRTLERRKLLFDRIRDAMTFSRPARNDSAKLEVLDRKGRDVSSWRSGLVGLLRSGSGYRGVPLDPEDLAHVVEDPSVTPERRVAAAVALSSDGDPSIKRRVRLAIEGCADDDLRASLARAAQGEIDESVVERATESQNPPARSSL